MKKNYHMPSVEFIELSDEILTGSNIVKSVDVRMDPCTSNGPSCNLNGTVAE